MEVVKVCLGVCVEIRTGRSERESITEKSCLSRRTMHEARQHWWLGGGGWGAWTPPKSPRPRDTQLLKLALVCNGQGAMRCLGTNPGVDHAHNRNQAQTHEYFLCVCVWLGGSTQHRPYCK